MPKWTTPSSAASTSSMPPRSIRSHRSGPRTAPLKRLLVPGSPPARTASGYRAYEQAHIRRLAFIRRARELGFSIEQIRALLALAEPSRASCAEVREIARTHLDEVRANLADLARLEGILAETISCCSGEPAPPCPVLNMLATSGRG